MPCGSRKECAPAGTKPSLEGQGDQGQPLSDIKGAGSPRQGWQSAPIRLVSHKSFFDSDLQHTLGTRPTKGGPVRAYARNQCAHMYARPDLRLYRWLLGWTAMPLRTLFLTPFRCGCVWPRSALE
jgi:hypothetical protein